MVSSFSNSMSYDQVKVLLASNSYQSQIIDKELSKGASLLVISVTNYRLYEINGTLDCSFFKDRLWSVNFTPAHEQDMKTLQMQVFGRISVFRQVEVTTMGKEEMPAVVSPECF